MKFVYCLLSSLLILFSNFVNANIFKTEKWSTPNGVRVVFYPAKEVPMLDLSLAFAAGSSFDGSQFGLSSLTTRLLNQGSAGQDATAIAEALADTGAQFHAENSRDMVVFNLRTLSQKEALNKSLATFTQIINHPDFPDDAFEREKKQLLMSIEQAKESPDDVANKVFFKKLYQDHPYAHSVNGTSKTINGLSKDQVIQFYKNYYVANNALLVIVGAIDSQTAHLLADKLTQDLPKGNPAITISKALQINKEEKISINFPSSQTIIRMGQLGIDHSNPDYFPLLVGNYILGGGSLVSRLAYEVREKRGLTYGVNSEFAPMLGQGPFLISLSTKNQEANKALQITQDTLKKFIHEGPSEQELTAAKLYITGSFPLSLASNQSIAGLLLRAAFYHLPDDYLDTYVAKINAVTSKQIQQAFQKQVNTQALLLVKVGQS